MYLFNSCLFESSLELNGDLADVFEVWLVSWCFKPSQPQSIISGLRETLIKRYIVERTNKADIRQEEQSEKVESCWEIYEMEYS